MCYSHFKGHCFILWWRRDGQISYLRVCCLPGAQLLHVLQHLQRFSQPLHYTPELQIQEDQGGEGHSKYMGLDRIHPRGTRVMIVSPLSVLECGHLLRVTGRGSWEREEKAKDMPEFFFLWNLHPWRFSKLKWKSPEKPALTLKVACIEKRLGFYDL